ncbi:MAG: RND transporter, partial [Methylobacter sp.]
MMLQWFLILVSVVISACTVGPDYHRPETPAPAIFKELNGWKEAQPRDNEIPGKWWETFEDPYLNSLEQQVDISNQSIAQAEAQF